MTAPKSTGAAVPIFIATLMVSCNVQAAVSPEQAAALGKELTPFGAEKAGNADGSIPEYTGGIPALHLGKGAGDFTEDPFANEKPLTLISAANMDEVAARLTEGTKELLRRYPTFCVDVYPTHRTISYPDWVLENTRRNATAAHTSNSGLDLKDALPGIPFPIPVDGSEVMWNHRIRYTTPAFQYKYETWLVPAATEPVLVGAGMSYWGFPLFNDVTRDRAIDQDEPLYRWRAELDAPQRRAGEIWLLEDVVNALHKPRDMRMYVPGQRRTRLINSPLDAPNSQSSGTVITDDSFVFTGTLERFDVKLLGKREMLVPYNTHGFLFQNKAEKILTPNHVSPDAMRWELHRVWVVEATLRPGEHHPYGRRVFYVDEDGWGALASDEYGPDGKLLRAVFALQANGRETGAPFGTSYLGYDFSSEAYYVAYRPRPGSGFRFTAPLPESTWSPDALAGSGVR